MHSSGLLFKVKFFTFFDHLYGSRGYWNWHCRWEMEMVETRCSRLHITHSGSCSITTGFWCPQDDQQHLPSWSISRRRGKKTFLFYAPTLIILWTLSLALMTASSVPTPITRKWALTNWIYCLINHEADFNMISNVMSICRFPSERLWDVQVVW